MLLEILIVSVLIFFAYKVETLIGSIKSINDSLVDISDSLDEMNMITENFIREEKDREHN